MDPEKLAWFRLCYTPYIGPITFKHLINQFKTASNALLHLNEYAKMRGRTTSYKVYEKDKAEQYFEQCEKRKVKVLASYEQEYPSKLRLIPDFPPILHAVGNTKLLSTKSVSIIGSRNCSLQGKKFAEYIAGYLSKIGITITSGLARGIDAAAHNVALKNTIAVLACGIDVVYPIENKELYEKIAQQGLLITQELITKEPRPESFVYRNRLIAALSKLVIVIEAAKKSGSLITAEYAASYGIDVFAVPGHPYDVRSAGTNSLIKNGASLLECAEDIENYLRDHEYQQIIQEPFHLNQFNEDVDINFVKEFIVEKLAFAPININEIINLKDFNINQIEAAIAILELEGKIEIHGSFVTKLPY